MRFKICIFVAAIFITQCSCQNGCSEIIQDGIFIWDSKLIVLGAIEDTGYTKNFDYTGTLTVEKVATDNASYFDITADQNILTISTNDQFSHIEEDVADEEPNGAYQIPTPQFIFTCNDNSPITLTISATLVDTNNHDPQFLKDSYRYTMPLPLLPGIDLTGFGSTDKIIVRDIDISNTEMTITSDNDNFIFQVTRDKKSFTVGMFVTKVTRLTGDTTITLTATDGGTPPRSSGTALSIQIDTANSSPPEAITFEKALYQFEYDEEADPVLQPVGGDIKIIDGDLESIVATLDDVTHFTADYDSQTHIVTLSPTGAPIEPSVDPFLTLTLNVADKTGAVGTAAIIIRLPSRDVIAEPKFSQTFYTATYSTEADPHTVALDDGQEISVTESASVSVQGDYEPNFSVLNQNDQLVLHVVTNLDESILKKGGEIVVTLQATVTFEGTEYTGEALVVVKLPELPSLPSFRKPHYTAVYEEGNKLSFEDTVQVDGADNNENLSVDIVPGELKKYFDTIYHSQTQTCTVSLKIALTSENLQLRNDFIWNLKLSTKGVSTSSVLVVTLSESEPVIPTFSRPYYRGSYQLITDDKDQVRVGPPITITSPLDQEVVVNFNEVTQNFILEQDKDDPHKWGIIVTNDLADTVLQGGLSQIFTLQATVNGIDPDNVGKSILVIDIPKVSPKFVKSYYEAEYTVDENGNALVILDEPIELTMSANANFTFIGPYAEQFVFVLNDTQQITVESKFEAVPKDHILLTLQVSFKNSEDTETTVIDLNLHQMLPRFRESVYVANYVLGGDTDRIELVEDKIVLENCANGEPTIEGTYADNFKLVPTTDGYSIELNGALDTEVLIHEVDIILTLRATVDEENYAYSTLVVNLPKEVKRPKFLRSVYTGKYDPETQTVDADNIETDTNFDEIDVSVDSEDPYNTNFDINYDTASGSYIVTVTNAPTIPATDKEIFIQLDVMLKNAPATDVNTAILVLKLPENAQDVVPEFSKVYYQAEYHHLDDGSTDAVEIVSDSIAIISDHSADTIVRVIDEYENNFDAIYDSGSWLLRIKTPLEPNVLATPEIIVSLEASLDGSLAKGHAAVQMILDSSIDYNPSPQFDKAIYTATYNENNTLVLNEPIIVKSTSNNVKVQLGAYNQYFEAQPNEDSWNVVVIQQLEPEDLINDELRIELVAHLENSVSDSIGVLIVSLPKINFFKQPKYTALYKTDTEKDSVELDDDIILLESATDLVIFGDHKDNFKVDCDKSNNQCSLSVATNLGDDVLQSETEVVLILEATRDNLRETGRATVLVKLPLQEKAKAPRFTEVVYKASYSETSPDIETDAVIAIENVQNVSAVEVSAEGDYKTYFSIVPKSDHWEVTVNGLPENVLDEEISILVNLVAKKADVAEAGYAGLVIELPKKTVSSPFHFKSNVYNAEYDDGSLSGLDDIEIDGDADGKADVTLAGDYVSFFEGDYSNGKVTISVKTPLTDEILNTKSVIFVSIKAVLNDEEITAILVIQLPKTDGTVLKFSKAAYEATYIYKDGDDNDEITLENGPIKIQGISDVSTANVTIEESDYRTYFDITTENNQWNIVRKLDIPVELLTEISILITVQGSQNGITGEAAIVIKLPKKQSPATFEFQNLVYNADYDKDKSSIHVEKDIRITGNTEGVLPGLSGDYQSYFNVTNNKDVITVGLQKALPQDILDKEIAISVNVLAVKESETATATLVVRLPKKTDSNDDDDDADSDRTELIVAVAVLAVLLVASLVGSAVFYYFKNKRSGGSSELDETPRLSERFRKNSNSDTKRKIEHGRRPTGLGLVKVNLEDVSPNETKDTFADTNEFERKKSVQFDTENIDELEIPKEEEDVDDKTAHVDPEERRISNV